MENSDELFLCNSEILHRIGRNFQRSYFEYAVQKIFLSDLCFGQSFLNVCAVVPVHVSDDACRKPVQLRRVNVDRLGNRTHQAHMETLL